jgi:ComF family protein
MLSRFSDSQTTGETMRTMLSRSIVQPLKDFLFPPLCFSCRERLSSDEDYLCAQCTRKLEPVADADYTMAVLKDRFANSDAVSSFYPLYYFEEEGVLQHVIHALKYEEITKLGELFGAILGTALQSRSDYGDLDAIIPVPLHMQKERERGYNQSEYICKGIARMMQCPIATGLVRRCKNTRSQTKLTAAERLDNVQDAFVVDEIPNKKIRGAKILLVDDVITTGATIHSCARALRAAGVGEIVCASIGIAKLYHSEQTTGHSEQPTSHSERSEESHPPQP